VNKAYQTLELDVAGPIAVLRLDGIGRFNLTSAQQLRDLDAAALALRDNLDCRVVILRGGDEHFCGGMHLDAFKDAAREPSILARQRAAELGGRAIRALRQLPQVTIAALDGVCAGGGACFATACDFRIATRTLRFGYPEVQRGLNLQWNAVGLCLQLCGPARTKQLVMKGDLHDAAAMLAWGLVDETVASSELTARTHALAREYASLPPVAVQTIKRSVNALSGALDSAVLHADFDQFVLASGTDDCREAVEAFLEKRTGTYRGC
jgi:enoyl-CoA hydratase/carnithine racemase